MTNSHGSFIWYELMTTDPEAAGSFYSDVIGWRVGGFGGATISGEGDYRIFTAPDGEGAGGMMKAPGDALPGWFGYIGVDDVDAATEAVKAAGGSVHVPPTDLPGVGRMALLADPQGAPFYVMRGSSDQPSTAFKATALGHATWNELVTSDPAGAMSFYTGQFGWKKDGEMPMGELGAYEFLSHDGGMIGAMMRAQEHSFWGCYFRVGAIDPVVNRIKAGGGEVLHGPNEVPGGDWVVQALDPQGARFGVVGSRG